jgi:hypothetical protein
MEPMRYRSYSEYLRHPEYLSVKALVMSRAGGKCEVCHARPPYTTHHRIYPAWGTFDVPENLLAVCHPCHCRIHGKED